MAGCGSDSHNRGRHQLKRPTSVANGACKLLRCSLLPAGSGWGGLQYSQAIYNLPVIPATPQLAALLAAGELGVVALSDLLETRTK